MTRLLVCGDRDFKNWDVIVEYLSRNKPSVVIEGEAPGADTLARIAAQKLKIEVIPFPVNWQKFGRRAGPVRNQQMLDEGKPDHVLACHWHLSQSIGTLDMVKRALQHGLPVDITYVKSPANAEIFNGIMYLFHGQLWQTQFWRLHGESSLVSFLESQDQLFQQSSLRG